MERWRRRYYGAVAMSVLSVIILGGSSFVAIEAWTTMNMIEAQGALGQAIQEERYGDAKFRLLFSSFGVVVGSALFLNALTENLKATMYRIADEES
jgi:hypothetical protein